MSIGMRLFEQRAGEVGEIWHVSHSSLMSHGKWKESHIDHGQYETHGIVSSATVDSVMLVSLPFL